VVGEHGDSQIVAWSCASIAGVPIDKAMPPESLDRVHLAEQCNHEAQHIIRAKGSIAFAMGSIVASICSSILFDKRDVRPLSHFIPEFGCCLSLPVVLGRKGLVHTIQLPLTTGEKARLAKSGERTKEAVKRLMEGDEISGMAAI
jgi:L-lactate dehydrogenase